MSVVLYRKKESGKIESGIFPPDQIPKNLEQLNREGWFLNPDQFIPDEPVTDFMGSVDNGMHQSLTIKELRFKAKEAGFKNWETARMKTLKKVLGL